MQVDLLQVPGCEEELINAESFYRRCACRPACFSSQVPGTTGIATAAGVPQPLAHTHQTAACCGAIGGLQHATRVQGVCHPSNWLFGRQPWGAARRRVAPTPPCWTGTSYLAPAGPCPPWSPFNPSALSPPNRRRYRVCKQHSKAAAVQLPAGPARFCQVERRLTLRLGGACNGRKGRLAGRAQAGMACHGPWEPDGLPAAPVRPCSMGPGVQY